MVDLKYVVNSYNSIAAGRDRNSVSTLKCQFCKFSLGRRL